VSNQTGGSVRSPKRITSPLRQPMLHSGRKGEPLPKRIGTTGISAARKTSKVAAPEMSICISQPLPRTLKVLEPTAATLPDTLTKGQRLVVPTNCTKEDWLFNWPMNNKNASLDERLFFILLRAYGFGMARSMALDQGWDCMHLITEAERRGF